MRTVEIEDGEDDALNLDMNTNMVLESSQEEGAVQKRRCVVR